MFALIIKIAIIIMFVIKLINFLLSFKLKRKIENYDILVAMSAIDTFDNRATKDVLNTANLLIIFAIIEFIALSFSLIGMFLTGHWILGVIFVLSYINFKYEKKEKQQDDTTNVLPLKAKKRKISSIISEIIQLILIVVFFFLL